MAYSVLMLTVNFIVGLCYFSLGKILNDDTALKEYKIDEKNFVVVMVAKVSDAWWSSIKRFEVGFVGVSV